MSELSELLKVKIKKVLLDVDEYNIKKGSTIEAGKELAAKELAEAITDWLTNLTIEIPTGLIIVSGSPATQTNAAPIKIPLKITLKNG